MGLDQILERGCQLPAAPVFQTMDGALVAFDQRLVALDHGRYLLALVRMDHEYDFIVTHGNSLWMRPAPTAPTPQPPVIPDACGGTSTREQSRAAHCASNSIPCVAQVASNEECAPKPGIKNGSASCRDRECKEV